MSEVQVAQHTSALHRAIRAAAALASAALVAASALVIAAPAQAATFTDGDFQYDSTSATEATVTGYTGGPTATIPSTVTDGTDTYTVTAIGNTAFNGKGLTAVTIPNTILSIGQSAFGNNSLVSVVIPDSVTSMSTAAFQFNSTLTSVSLGSSLTSIPGYTFWQSGLTHITIPSNIASIGEQAFFNSPLVSLDVPDSVISIGAEAFASNDSMTSLHLGSSVESIGSYAFNFSALTTVVFPNSVTSIGDNAFGDTASLTSAVFQGAAPSTFTARSSGHGSFGDQDVTVYYSSAHVGDFTPSPWNGYDTAPGATLTFAMGGHGAAIAPVVVIPGGTVPKPADPIATDYAFQGWFTTASGTVPFDFTTPLTSDSTAYAHWAATGLAATGTDQGPAVLIGGGILLVGLALVIATGVVTRRRRAKSE